MNLSELMSAQPIVPYIRESDYAVRKPWVMPERRLLDYLLIYVQEGRLRVWLDGVSFDFSDGDFCLIQPGSLSSMEGLTNTITPYAHLDIFYNPLREQSFPTRAGQTDLTAYARLMQPRLNDIAGVRVPARFRPSHPIPFRDALLAMVESWRRNDPLGKLEAQHLATELVLSLLREYGQMPSPSVTSPQAFNWITSYFSFHLSEPLSVEDMARRANLSPSRFSAVFKRQFGMPPHQYLLELRIRHASELLADSRLPLQEIAQYCGFADVQHFSKAFKKKTGRSPGAYREKPDRQ